MTSTTTPTEIAFAEMTDTEVQAALSEYQIGLTVDEARKIQELLGRAPSLVEATIWGIQGSEHCSYKSSRPFLKAFTTSGKHIILGPVEDSGVVAITDEPKGKRWGFVITHESHNHPSQIVPYEGAATGVGGTVRDVLCMGARVIGCMDLLRLGDQETEERRTIANEIVRGIGGYGNPLGVPNLGGDTVYDSSYNSNCLVNAIALGIVREDEIIHSYVPKEAGEVGYDIILFGKPTDRSGFGGASFASASMEEDKREQNTGAVQEPNPFLERHLLASSYALFDWLAATGNLDKVSCKDLGAGGVVCATVEQVADQGFGAEIDLDKVHTALPDLPAEVIACAETQERLCWMCHPSLTEHILDHYNSVWDLPGIAEHAGASLIGKVTKDDTFRVRYQGEIVCEAKATDITSGLQYNRPTEEYSTDLKEPNITYEDGSIAIGEQQFSLQEVFDALLNHENAVSREPIYKHYDKNVIGNTVIDAGEADAGVIAPLQDLQSYVLHGEHPDWDLSDEDRWRGVAVAGDGNGRYGRIDPYWQGVNAAVEAMRNVAAVGAVPRALTDCLNYGNPEIPEQLWQLKRGIEGIADASNSVQPDGEPVPIISGNVSLYNGKPDGSAIDPTAIVACVGIMPDARTAVNMQLKKTDSHIILIGDRKNECGGSLYYSVLERLLEADTDAVLGAHVPQPDFVECTKHIRCVTSAIQQNTVLACHDISEGGLALALWEMMQPQRQKGGDIGISIDIAVIESDLRPDQILFTETGGWIVEISDADLESFQNIATKEGVAFHMLGKTTDEKVLRIRDGEEILIER